MLLLVVEWPLTVDLFPGNLSLPLNSARLYEVIGSLTYLLVTGVSLSPHHYRWRFFHRRLSDGPLPVENSDRTWPLCFNLYVINPHPHKQAQGTIYLYSSQITELMLVICSCIFGKSREYLCIFYVMCQSHNSLTIMFRLSEYLAENHHT